MFWRRGIRYKLAIALWGVAIIAFAAAGLALVLFENLTMERRAWQIMEPYAQLVSVGTEAAVAFEDPVRAQEILNTLRTNPQLSGAEIFLRDGRLLARYSSRSKVASLPHSLKPDGVYLNHNNAELLQSLQDGARLRLVMSLNELNRQTQEVLWKFAMGMFVLLVTITLALRAALQKTIIGPISTLVKTVEQVRTRDDYSRRVPASGVDEVGRLGQSFNAMMGVIQEREDDLRRLTLFQRTILDNAAYGIVSTTTDGIVSSFNPAAERLLGYTSDEVVGKLTPACWHDQEEIALRALQLSEELGETVPPGFEVLVARLRRNQSEENEWTYMRKDGTRAPMFLSVTALRKESGQITGYVGLIYDLTERKRAEDALLESERMYRELSETLEVRVTEAVEELEQKNRMLILQSRQATMGEMLSNIAHQWRQPLNMLGLLAQELQFAENHGNLTGEFMATNVKRTMEIIQHMSKTIDDFRHFFMPEKEKIRFRVLDVVEKTLSLLEAAFGAYQINTETVAAGDPVLEGYPNEYSQVLLNILTNAKDAFLSRDVADPKIVIRVDTEGDKSVVTITDNAGGIPKEIIDKIFDPYFTTKGPEQGTGVGLFMSKTIIEKNMGGALSVRNTDGGAEFRIKV
ncbi:MAG TPA: hypothetical protein DCZ75_08815 [Geobacter sp.]|nr:hypothetical protein [Geobacter sp.]